MVDAVSPDLRLLFDQLSLTSSTSAESSSSPPVSDAVVAVTASFTIDVFLTKVIETEFSLAVQCRAIQHVIVCATRDWLLPELATLLYQCEAELCHDGTGEFEVDSSQLIAEIIDKKYVPVYGALADALYERAAVGKFASEEDACAADYADKAVTSCSVMITYTSLLEKLQSLDEQCKSRLLRECSAALGRIIKSLCCKALMLSFEHHSDHPWTNALSVQQAKHVVNTMCCVNNCTTLELLLNDCNTSAVESSFIKNILTNILPQLTSSKWKLYPAVPYVFYYCLQSLKQPTLSDYLPMVLPPSFLFVDDFQAANRLLGLKCLQHIMDNVSRTELQWFGRADVIYDSLLKAFYSSDKAALDALILCLFAVLDIVEDSPRRASGMRTDCKHDQLFTRYLSDMELQNSMAVRRIYSQHLATFVEKLGISVVKHMNRVIRVVDEYLQVYDGPLEQCRIGVLNALWVLLREAWPRIPCHGNSIMKALVHLLHDIGTEKTTTPLSVVQSLTEQAMKCVTLLQKICPEYLELDENFFAQVMQQQKVS